MKKLLAIFLLSIHLFNMGGYHVLYQYFIYQSDKVMNEHIAKNEYNVHELVQVKIPVSMPGIDNETTYQSISGQIQFRQGCYNYVKLRLTSDTMFVMCVPNYEKTRLLNSNVICAKQLADLPVSKHDNLPSIKKSGQEIYDFETFNFYLNSAVTDLRPLSVYKVLNLKTGMCEKPFLPPDHTC